MPDNSGTHLEYVTLVAFPPPMIRPKYLIRSVKRTCLSCCIRCCWQYLSILCASYRELLLVVHVLPKRWQKRSSIGQLTSVVVTFYSWWSRRRIICDDSHDKGELFTVVFVILVLNNLKTNSYVKAIILRSNPVTINISSVPARTQQNVMWQYFPNLIFVYQLWN